MRRLLTVLVLVAFVFAPSVDLSARRTGITLIAHYFKSNHGGSSPAAVTTTNANLFVAIVCNFPSLAVPSDNKGNTWTALTGTNISSDQAAIYYVSNPVVGTGHTFDENGTFGAVYVEAFSGVKTSSPKDQSTQTTAASTTTGQPGSITPTEDNEVVFTGFCTSAGTTKTVNGGFTKTDDSSSATDVGGAAAYLIQTAAAAANPTWTSGTSAQLNLHIASFKAAPVAASTFGALLFSGTI